MDYKEKVIALLNDQELSKEQKEKLENIFPELKESKDERIVRCLLNYFNHVRYNGLDLKGTDVDEVIVWLEKQKEPEDKGEISDGYHTFNELYRYRLLYNAAFFNLLPKELVHKSKKHHDGEECFGGGWFIVMANLPTGQISNHYELKYWNLFQIPEKEIADEWDGHTPQEAADRLHEYLLEKRGKQNPIKLNETDEKIRKAIISILKGETGYTSKEDTDRYVAWLEKQGEKKPIFNADDWYVSKVDGKIHNMNYNPTDKVEPKFKVGDFIANDYCSGKVIEITNDAYLLDTGQGIPFSCEHNAHLWTIEDAKDGDVLVTIAIRNCPFIYRKTDYNNNLAYYYAGIDGSGDFCEGCIKRTLYHFGPLSNVVPATKEQRDQLFQKMEKAGYEWDAEKKELKKIEPKTLDVWNAEDEQNLNVVLSFIPDEYLRRWLKDKLCYDTLDAYKVIAWLVGNICDYEYYVKLFKKDFGL